MMRKSQSDRDDALLPFPVAPVSNGEWCPLPITDKQRTLARMIIEETTAGAKRHGMTRGQFLRTAAATMIAFSCVNKVYGLDQGGGASAMPIKKQHCDDLDAAREVLDRKMFVMDVQQHHVDLQKWADTDVFCFLDFRPELHPGIPCPEDIGQAQYVKDVFVNSETDVGVISGLPAAVPLGPSAMAQTRDLVNQLAGSERALSQAVCDPTAPAGAETHIDTMEMQVKVLKGRALKCYTYSYGGWRLDDANGTKMLEEATRLGIKLVNTHKGLPAIFAPGSPETVRTIDYPQALKNFPKMKFCAYHSGYFQGDTHPEGKGGITEWIEVLESLDKKDRKRMYSEIGSTFAFVWLSGPDNAAHFIGQLLKTLGPKNILWGTDSVWWGSPQWLIDAFKALEIPESMQEQFGYPALTDKVKRRILGENAAKLYGVKRNQERCTVPEGSIPPDNLQKLQLAQGGARHGRNLRWYGPQTRRGFLSLLRGEWRPRV
jgi:hypothetical protein